MVRSAQRSNGSFQRLFGVFRLFQLVIRQRQQVFIRCLVLVLLRLEQTLHGFVELSGTQLQAALNAEVFGPLLRAGASLLERSEQRPEVRQRVRGEKARCGEAACQGVGLVAWPRFGGLRRLRSSFLSWAKRTKSH